MSSLLVAVPHGNNTKSVASKVDIFGASLRGLRRSDVSKTSDGHDVVLAEQDTGAVSADAESDRVIDVDFSSGRAVAEIMQVSIQHLDELLVATGERSQAHVR